MGAIKQVEEKRLRPAFKWTGTNTGDVEEFLTYVNGNYDVTVTYSVFDTDKLRFSFFLGSNEQTTVIWVDNWVIQAGAGVTDGVTYPVFSSITEDSFPVLFNVVYP
jgi:hypothetical protein